jgi:hypothetical protein
MTRWKNTYVGESSHARTVTGPFVGLCYPAGAGVPLAIALVEELLRHDPVAIEHENARVWQVDVARVGLDAIHRVVFLDPVVDETQPAHRLTAFVGEQGIGDPVRGGEASQDPTSCVLQNGHHSALR